MKVRPGGYRPTKFASKDTQATPPLENAGIHASLERALAGSQDCHKHFDLMFGLYWIQAPLRINPALIYCTQCTRLASGILRLNLI